MKFRINSTSGDDEYWKDKETKQEEHLCGKKKYKSNVTVIEFSNLEELVKFVKEIGKEVIISCEWYDIPEIEVYDYWRE